MSTSNVVAPSSTKNRPPEQRAGVKHNRRQQSRWAFYLIIPTLVLLRDGVVVRRIVGAQPEPVLTREVEQALASA